MFSKNIAGGKFYERFRFFETRFSATMLERTSGSSNRKILTVGRDISCESFFYHSWCPASYGMLGYF